MPHNVCDMTEVVQPSHLVCIDSSFFGYTLYTCMEWLGYMLFYVSREVCSTRLWGQAAQALVIQLTGDYVYCNTREYPKVFGLAAWSENCKWYSSLPLDVVVSLFCESV